MATNPSRLAAALNYLQQMQSGVGQFVGGVGENLLERGKSAAGFAREAMTSDPNMYLMNTAEFANAANARQTPLLDAAARDIGAAGKAIVTQPVETGKAILSGEVERFKGALNDPRAAGQYAGSFIDPLRIAKALRRPSMLELDVYHGTPHRFPATEANPLGEFDASKIGTGEGAQAYGHGTYLAEKPEIAKQYADNVKDEASIKKIYEQMNSLAREMAKISIGYRKYTEPRGYDLAKQYDELDDQRSAILKKPGEMYKVDLPDDQIAKMLDWDKPLSEQSKKIQDAVKPLLDRVSALPDSALAVGERKYLNNPGSLKGGDVYNMFKRYFGGDRISGEEASKILKEAGVPGIRYLDAGSRGTGKGTRNFVVFPGEEKKLKILERNGQKADPQEIAKALQLAKKEESYISSSKQSDPILNREGDEIGVDEYHLIDKLFTDPSERGKGKATELLKAEIKRLQAEDPYLPIKVAALPFDENSFPSPMDMESLVNFYEKHGFTVENTDGNAVGMIIPALKRKSK